MKRLLTVVPVILILLSGSAQTTQQNAPGKRQRISFDDGWRFMRYTSAADSLFYDERPVVGFRNDNIVADTRATDTGKLAASEKGLKAWILPSANDFIKDPAKHHQRPAGNPGIDFPFTQLNFNDKDWEPLDLPHDWAIKGPFYEGNPAVVGGGMGRLPIQGVAWYRKKLSVTAADKGKNIYLDIDGAMSYAMVWCNGKLVGGWPYGYNSFRLDLTPYIHTGENQVAIRIDNPNHSARWYPGAGLYRHVWLTKVNPVHVAQWGTFISTRNVSGKAATVDLQLEIENRSASTQSIEAVTDVYVLNDKGQRTGTKIAGFSKSVINIPTGKKQHFKTVLISKIHAYGDRLQHKAPIFMWP
jgi:beta-galactosidase